MIRDLWSMTDRRSKMTLAWLIALAALAALAQGAAFVALLPLLLFVAIGAFYIDPQLAFSGQRPDPHGWLHRLD